MRHNNTSKASWEGADKLLQEWAANTRGTYVDIGYPHMSPEQKERLGVFFDSPEDMSPEEERTALFMIRMKQYDQEAYMAAALEYKARSWRMAKIREDKGWWNAEKTHFTRCDEPKGYHFLYWVKDNYGMAKSVYYRNLRRAKHQVKHFVLG